MASKYEHTDAGEERSTKVSPEAGRSCVRNLQLHPVLSTEWLAVVDWLKQLAQLMQLEGRLPSNSKVTEVQGRNQDSDGTLWDQEANENAVRILVEEAKVNLCLRMMHDYKQWQCDEQRRIATIEQAQIRLDYSQDQLNQKCRQFEEFLGLLLNRAFMHQETLQLTDIPLFIEHIAFVLKHCEKSQGALNQAIGFPNSKLQETVVLKYFRSLMLHAESLNNSEVLSRCHQNDLVMLVTRHIVKHMKAFQRDVLVAICEGFSAMANNEDFGPRLAESISNADDAGLFLQIETSIVEQLLTEDPKMKKDFRPLLDLFRKLERTYK